MYILDNVTTYAASDSHLFSPRPSGASLPVSIANARTALTILTSGFHALRFDSQASPTASGLPPTICDRLHQLALLRSENQILGQAKPELSKRRRARKARLWNGGSLSLQDGQYLQEQVDVEKQIKKEIRAGSGRIQSTKTRARCCGRYGKTGHNKRTCQIVLETPEEDGFD